MIFLSGAFTGFFISILSKIFAKPGTRIVKGCLENMMRNVQMHQLREKLDIKIKKKTWKDRQISLAIPMSQISAVACRLNVIKPQYSDCCGRGAESSPLKFLESPRSIYEGEQLTNSTIRYLFGIPK